MTIPEKAQHLRELLHDFSVAESNFLEATRRHKDFDKTCERRRVAILAFTGAARTVLPSVLDRLAELETENEQLNRTIYDLAGRLQRFEEDAS